MANPEMRLARATDAQGILAVYEPYINETAITFECKAPSLAEFTERIEGIASDYPYLVVLQDGAIAGYAYAHRHMEREAYQWNAELSVYVHRAHFRQGIGKALYTAVIEILKLQNICNVYAGVTSPNTNSESLHDYFGFAKLGTYHKTGYKRGAWHDVTWYGKSISSYSDEPKPFLSIREISGDRLAEIIARNAELLH